MYFFCQSMRYFNNPTNEICDLLMCICNTLYFSWCVTHVAVWMHAVACARLPSQTSVDLRRTPLGTVTATCTHSDKPVRHTTGDVAEEGMSWWCVEDICVNVERMRLRPRRRSYLFFIYCISLSLSLSLLFIIIHTEVMFCTKVYNGSFIIGS